MFHGKKFNSSQIRFFGQRSRGIKQTSSKKMLLQIVTANNVTATCGGVGRQTHDRSEAGTSTSTGSSTRPGNITSADVISNLIINSRKRHRTRHSEKMSSPASAKSL
jgi:hypothetical protein